MRRLRILGSCLIFLYLAFNSSWADNINNVDVSVQFPARLSLGERVTVSFNYSTIHSEGCAA